MRRLCLALILTTLPAFAEGYEVQFAPYLGYSNFSGLHLGLDSSLSVPLSQRWQWQFGGGFVTRTKSNYKTFSLTTGPVYNFSDDFSEAFFAGAGVGYGNRYAAFGKFEDDRSAFGYVEFGKRFQLNKARTFTWVPTVHAASNFNNEAYLSINPLSFSWVF